jgi:hypothetical protein
MSGNAQALRWKLREYQEVDILEFIGIPWRATHPPRGMLEYLLAAVAYLAGDDGYKVLFNQFEGKRRPTIEGDAMKQPPTPEGSLMERVADRVAAIRRDQLQALQLKLFPDWPDDRRGAGSRRRAAPRVKRLRARREPEPTPALFLGADAVVSDQSALHGVRITDP